MDKQYQITIIRPAGYIHSNTFKEVAETLQYGIRRLGHVATIEDNQLSAEATNIILGSNLIHDKQIGSIPPSSILYNLEQIDPTSITLTPTIFRLIRSFETWDYSQRNIKRLTAAGYGDTLRHVPLGYVPELTRIAPSAIQDIDVLFYGSVNHRRAKIINDLKDAGLSVAAVFGIYGTERDALIARAKVVLNVHFYDSGIFEVVRVSYLLSNRKAVVAECHNDTAIDEDLKDAVALVRYQDLVSACQDLVKNDAKRHILEQRGFERMSARDESAILRSVLAAPLAFTPSKRNSQMSDMPTKINLGSGKDWRADYLNIDVNPYWKPDIVADLNQPLPPTEPIETSRFGVIALHENMFDEIIANDFLEHIRDLTTAMTSCLKLLKIGGEFKTKVPYDLSYGAWQDPTHVRTFNERSWLYYTDWFWYLGWTEARFDLIANQINLSQIGVQLQNKGIPFQDILLQPRAVDDMQVVLRKRLLTDAEKETVKHYLKRPDSFV